MFSYEDPYPASVAGNHTDYLSGSFSTATVVECIIKFALNPTLFASLSILTVGGVVFNKKISLFIKRGIVLFFSMLGVLQPKLHPGFSTYILPFAYIADCRLFEVQPIRKLRFTKGLAAVLVALTLAYGV